MGASPCGRIPIALHSVHAGALPIGLAVLTPEAGTVKERKGREGGQSVPETPSTARAHAALAPLGPAANPLECRVHESALTNALPLQPRERAIVPVIVHAAQVREVADIAKPCKVDKASRACTVRIRGIIRPWHSTASQWHCALFCPDQSMTSARITWAKTLTRKRCHAWHFCAPSFLLALAALHHLICCKRIPVGCLRFTPFGLGMPA